MFKWLRKIFGRTTNADLVDEIDRIIDANDEITEAFDARISEIEAKQSAFQAEIWEYVDGTLQPLTKRMATRLSRSKPEALNSGDDKRTGVIPASELARRRE